MDGLETHDARHLIAHTCNSIEPGIYLPEFGVRSEVNVYVGEDEARVTGSIQKEILALLASARHRRKRNGRRDGSTGGSAAGFQTLDDGVRHSRGRMARAWFRSRPHENVGPRGDVFFDGRHARDSWRRDAGQCF